MGTLNKTREDDVRDPRSPSTQISVGELWVWLARLLLYCFSSSSRPRPLIGTGKNQEQEFDKSQEQEVVYNDPNNWEIDTIVVAINLWWLGYFKEDPSFLPYMDVVPVPKYIVEAVMRE